MTVTHNPTFFSSFFYFDIHLFFRFAAEIRPSNSRFGRYNLPQGDITNFTELIDMCNNFDPKTGVFTIHDDKDEGVYQFHFSTYNRSGLRLGVWKNIDEVRDIIRSLESYSTSNQIESIYASASGTVTSVFTLYLQKGDELVLYNYANQFTGIMPLTFTGYKI